MWVLNPARQPGIPLLEKRPERTVERARSGMQQQVRARLAPIKTGFLAGISYLEKVKLAVVIPVGPNLRYNFVLDTLRSVQHFMPEQLKIVIVDDSGENIGSALTHEEPSIDVVKTTRDSNERNAHGKLYLAVSLGFQHVLDNYDFSILLRFDTDALVIGAGAEDEALQFFEENPNVGLIGSYKVGSDGNKRDFSKCRRRLIYELNALQAILDPRGGAGRRFFREMVRKAVSNGYEYGEHCLAGSTFFSPSCLRKLAQENLLGRTEFKQTRLGDDQLFGILIKAIGFEMADFATGNLPMGVRWRGLPFAPEELLERRKKLIHSTKFWKDLDEEQIRRIFKNAREAQSA